MSELLNDEQLTCPACSHGLEYHNPYYGCTVQVGTNKPCHCTKVQNAPIDGFHQTMLNHGWEPPTNSLDHWKPPVGTLLRHTWDVDVSEYQKAKEEYYANQVKKVRD